MKNLFASTAFFSLYVAVSSTTLASHPDRPPRIAVFYETSFPSVDGFTISRNDLNRALDGYEVHFVGLDSLIKGIAGFDLLISPYGSAFSKRGWLSLLNFLRTGGNFVNLGGAPFSVPVIEDSTGWLPESRQTQFHKRLGITQTFPVSAGSINSFQKGIEEVDDRLLHGFSASEVYELYYRLTETIDFPNESGSSGARDATIHPLIFGLSREHRRVAAPFILISQIQGEFAGGRWVLANFKGTISSEAVRTLAEIALEPRAELRVRPSFACYHEGEIPSFMVQVRNPGTDRGSHITNPCKIEIVNEKGKIIESLETDLTGEGTLSTGRAESRQNSFAPGFYHVRARIMARSMHAAHALTFQTGFWVASGKMLYGGKPLTVDKNYFWREGKPYPVSGTTYMGSDVHRKFLFEPNPHIWDIDFADMKSAGVNMIRTGIWTGWRNYMLDPGALNEGSLRALDAFILTARKHDIPIIFTFFAFLPETWGGVNAYLDPRSLDAQKEFVDAIVQRYRGVNDLLWDLINEPSFCNPRYLWSCRPNYDRFESEAWNAWLRRRFPLAPEQHRTSKLQEMFRMTTEEYPALPPIEEFSDANIFNDNRPLRVVDYKLFAQETFSRWAEVMADEIRKNSNPNQLITVGQDEGGTNEGPSPHFFGNAVDFTCLHNWWLNDDLAWDNVMMKAPGKANLVEETGVMFYEKPDGSAWRTEEEAANLLERKLAISMGTGGAGFIEWIWNTNPFMKSDNEAAIGFNRADGTAKPEIEPFLDISRFLASNRSLMTGRRDEEVVLVIPHSYMYSPRNLATEVTRRSVRAMLYHCNVPMSSVSEYRLNDLKDPPKLLIVPSPRTVVEDAWKTLLKLAEDGSTVLITGPFERDDHWLPIERLKQFGIDAGVRPVAQEEFLTIDGTEYRLSYRGEKIQRVEKGVAGSASPSEVIIIQRGKGRILWSPLPVELAESADPSAALYALALKQAGCAQVFSREKKDPSILIIPTIFENSVLYTCVSESDRDTRVKFTHLETKTPIELIVPAQRSTLIFVDRKSGKIVAMSGMRGSKE